MSDYQKKPRGSTHLGLPSDAAPQALVSGYASQGVVQRRSRKVKASEAASTFF
jgi:hypothetical protein